MEADRVLHSVESTERWPGRIRALAARWRQPADARAREADLAEMWRLLNLVLHRAVRSRAGLHGPIGAADVVDLAADKAIELLGQLDTGRWEPAACTDAQVSAYVAAVARHGLIDRRRRHRLEAASAAASAEAAPPAGSDGLDLELGVDGIGCAQAIVDCAARLTSRARRAWFLRVFCEFTAAEIAAHPDIRSTVGGAELMLHRSRRRIRKCVASKGYEPERIPPGTFTALWEMLGRAPVAPSTRGRAEGKG